MGKKKTAKKIADRQKKATAEESPKNAGEEDPRVLLHPLVTTIIEVLKERESPAGFEFAGEDIDVIREEITGTFGEDAVVHLLCSNLFRLAASFKEEFDAPIASQQIFDLLDEEAIVAELKAISERHGENEIINAREAGKAELAKFTDRDSEKKAPDVDAEKPEGAISIDDLDFPKRL